MPQAKDDRRAVTRIVCGSRPWFDSRKKQVYVACAKQTEAVLKQASRQKRSVYDPAFQRDTALRLALQGMKYRSATCDPKARKNRNRDGEVSNAYLDAEAACENLELMARVGPGRIKVWWWSPYDRADRAMTSRSFSTNRKSEEPHHSKYVLRTPKGQPVKMYYTLQELGVGAPK